MRPSPSALPTTLCMDVYAAGGIDRVYLGRRYSRPFFGCVKKFVPPSSLLRPLKIGLDPRRLLGSRPRSSIEPRNRASLVSVPASARILVASAGRERRLWDEGRYRLSHSGGGHPWTITPAASSDRSWANAALWWSGAARTVDWPPGVPGMRRAGLGRFEQRRRLRPASLRKPRALAGTQSVCRRIFRPRPRSRATATEGFWGAVTRRRRVIRHHDLMVAEARSVDVGRRRGSPEAGDGGARRPVNRPPADVCRREPFDAYRRHRATG